jgi:hypothetical protein
LSGDVRVSADSVFLHDVQVVRLDQILSTIPISEVSTISIIGYRSSPGWTVAGSAAGLFAGFWTAVRIAFSPCGGSCSDEQVLMVASIVGFPVLGGSLAYRGTRHEVEHVVYRAP